MPELPEVETVVRTLRQQFLHATIDRIHILDKKNIFPSVDSFQSALTNNSIKDIQRIGKFIIFIFVNNIVVVSHLRMEGKYIEIPANETQLTRFARVVFYMKDCRKLVYDDMRRFGTFHVSDVAHYRTLPSLRALGVEPIESINPTMIHNQFNQSKRPIKSLLLDQTILLGIGNIYADEILYASRIHPLVLGCDLTISQTSLLLKESKRILKKAISMGGTRIRSYQSGHAIDGQFVMNLGVYGRHEKPCKVCQHRIDRITVAGRGTHYCPRCQHHPNFPFVIGVTGKIATGKSTLLSMAKKLNIPTLLADDIVAKLYQTSSIIAKIKKFFPNAVRQRHLDRSKLLHEMILNDRQSQKMINWLFPLVKQEIEKKLIAMNVKLVVVEVPLLFQSGIDALCDVIVGVEMPEALARKRLFKRSPNHGESLWVLNERNHYADYLQFIDHRLVNQGTLKAWEKTGVRFLQSMLKKL